MGEPRERGRGARGKLSAELRARALAGFTFHLHVLGLAQLLFPGLLVLLLLLMVVHVGLGLGLGGGGLGLSRGGLRACVGRGRGGGAAGPRQRPGLGARLGGLRRGSGE